MLTGSAPPRRLSYDAVKPPFKWSRHSGGTDPDTYAKAKAANRINETPTNHNPRLLPVVDPSLETGVNTLMVATRAWLAA